MPPNANHKTRKRIEGHNHARALNWSCYKNQPFLQSKRACEWLVERIEAARAKHRFQLWAWCIMPTHVHMLIYPGPTPSASSVSDILRSIKLPVTQRAIAWARLNSSHALDRMRHESSSGAATYRFWQRGGGYDRNLFEPSAIHEMIDYIHRNPVEEGLCARATDWPWSSAITFKSRSLGKLTLDLESLPVLTVAPGSMLAR